MIYLHKIPIVLRYVAFPFLFAFFYWIWIWEDKQNIEGFVRKYGLKE